MALVTEFISSIRGYVLRQEGSKLRDWLRVEQSVPAQYYALAQELRTDFRAGGIDQFIEKALPEEDDVPDGGGSPWPGFVVFMKEYMQYWRDVNFEDPVRCYELLSSLLTACATALSHPTYGSILFETSISLSTSLSKLVMMLHKRPELTRKLRVSAAGDEESKSIVESTADTIQKIFTTCLTDRSSTRWSKPEGKKVGVYIFANLVLKLLFACRKSRLAVQMFTNIATSGPALSLFPASQRVTYLYYLGRFNFENNSFLRAALCLEAAYLQTPPSCQSHRRQILTYLIPSNMMLGRFPSSALLLRPEAATLRPIFQPLIHALRSGNFASFQHALKTHEDWLFDRGLLLTLSFRLRPILWRSLSRRVFLLTYTAPSDSTTRKAPTLDLGDLVAAACLQQKQLEGFVPAQPQPRPRAPHINTLFLKAVRNNAAPSAADAASTLVPPPGGPLRLRPGEGLLWGNLLPDLPQVEGIVASLVAQGLLHGFVAHAAGKFAVVGAKIKGSALAAGWPLVAAAIKARVEDEVDGSGEVPAWVKMG